MTHITEAIYSNGVLKPVEALMLRDQQRVRIIIEPVDGLAGEDREGALRRLRQGIERMDFRSADPLPSRDEYHDRP